VNADKQNKGSCSEEPEGVKMGIQNVIRISTHNNKVIELLQVGEEYRIDSRILAPGLNIEHHNFMQTIRIYQPRFEHFGILLFETEEIKGRGQPEKFVLLNRNHILFAITLSRNTEEVLDWKESIINALDQLEKQVRNLIAIPQQKQLQAPKNHGRKPKVKYQHKNSKVFVTPEQQYVEILRHMDRLWERKQEPITANALVAYTKHHMDVFTIRIRLNELVEMGVLHKIKTIQAPGGKYLRVKRLAEYKPMIQEESN
jgi:phage regulator Rha-like protein